MITTSNLTKVYKSKKEDSCVAINDISFTLPDKGMVFIIGKSGSGKTTLLSLLGGLDNITSGNVIVDGCDFSEFSVQDYDYYRNDKVGFIFQDFCLIDEFTIFENVSITLKNLRIYDDELVYKTLESVGLKGYEERYPKELSGGEQQRVAIARAIIKDPKVILADEPTGNLDKNTSNQILDILKDYSKSRLVLIVSHNINDAMKYGDALIELSDGKIIGRFIRNKDYKEELEIKDETLIIPYNKVLSEEEEKFIEKKIENKDVKRISINDKVFIDEEEKEEDNEKKDTVINKQHISFRDMLAISFQFLRNNVVALLINAFIVAAIAVIIGFSQLIFTFDSNEFLNRELADYGSDLVALNKTDNVERDWDAQKFHHIPIEDSDIQYFYDNGYTGNIYKRINFGVTLSAAAYLDEDVVFMKKSLYANTFSSLLITDEDFLIEHFGVDGKLEYCALADEIKDYGFYITDYLADDILLNNRVYQGHTYEELVGVFKGYTIYTKYGYINGIINTHYHERADELMEKFKELDADSDEFYDLINSDEYLAFYDEALTYLCVAYTTNNNFIDDYIDSGCATIVSVNNYDLYYGDRKLLELPSPLFVADETLNDNEISLGYQTYNQLFNTNYNMSNYEEFVPHEVRFLMYSSGDKEKTDVKMEYTFTIAKLSFGETNYFSTKTFKEVQRFRMYTYGLYLDNTDDIDLIMTLANDRGYSLFSLLMIALRTMSNAVVAFDNIFLLIFGVLCCTAFIILINYGFRIVNNNKRSIGIFKAIGVRNRDVGIIFGVQLIVLLLCTMVMFICGSLIFIKVANKVLIKALLALAYNKSIPELQFIAINGKVLLIDCLLILAITTIAFIIPIIKYRRIKPINIIKAKE